MFKESIICIIIIITIIFGNYVTQNYTKETVTVISAQLKSLREDMLNKGSDNQTIKTKLDEIYQKWQERHDKLAYFIEHDELEKIETELIGMKSYIEAEDYEEAINELDKSSFLFKHIEDKYDFNLQNVF